MAIYHLEAKVISRGIGRSAVAASAYMSCSRMYNDYDGVQHDYTRKQDLVWQQIFLPDMVPAEWADRETLWNAVEENEKTKDSRLAREFVVALPIGLGKAVWQKLLTEFIWDNFVSDGMCADVCIHDTDDHNPHAHIMMTVRPLAENGTWQHKTEKEYLCVRNGEEQGFTAAEFKEAQADGWEKQYPYKVRRKKVYMPPSEAEKHGYEQANKHPKSTKFGRQNPIAERWNSEEQLIEWRKAWADVTNRYLERYGHNARIDHRSHAERGLDEQPTIHEGVVARALEAKGIVADRCEINRQIKADNALLRELKAQVKKLADAVKNTISVIAEAMEGLRQKMIIFRYQLLHIRSGKAQIGKSLDAVRPDLERYVELVKQIKGKAKERQALLAEKKATPMLQMLRHRELAQKIAGLTEDLEELKSEKAALLHVFECADDVGMSEVSKHVTNLEVSLQKLSRQEEKYARELDTALAQYTELKEQSADMDAAELTATRQAIRLEKERGAVERIKAAYGEQYDGRKMRQSQEDIAAMLGEDREPVSIRQRLKEIANQQQVQQQQQKSKHHEQER